MPCIHAVRAGPASTSAERRGSTTTSSPGSLGVAGVGAHAPGPEPHRPVVGERERRHHRAELGVVGVHPDPLTHLVLVDDALLRHRTLEPRRQAIGHHRTRDSVPG